VDLSTRSPRRAPIFLDETGRRWRRLRRAALVVGIITTVVAAITITMVVIPPLLPEIPLTGAPFARAPSLATSKIERERLSKKLQLYFSLRKNRVPGVSANVLPVRGRAVPGRVRAPGAPIVAGFYVTWDDNSLDALLHHADDPQPLIAEGEWHGEIAQQACGDGGFGYDPLFWLPEFGKTSAQLEREQKHAISHRGKALRVLLERLKDF